MRKTSITTIDADQHPYGEVIELKSDVVERLDVFLANELDGISRSYVANMIKRHEVKVNGNVAKAGQKLKPTDRVEFILLPPKECRLIAQDIPLDIIYQDADIVVVNKPKGMVVHPAPGNPDGTLVNALLYHIKDLAGIGGELRPGIVHRIDKDTSGLLVVAKNDESHRNLSQQIKSKEAGRFYLAIVEGNITNDEGTIDAPLGRSKKDRKKIAVVLDGKPAVTNYRVLERFGAYTYVECRLQTGRTHQIRVHMCHIGHPIAGDEVYGKNKQKLGLQGQALHAYELHLTHPRTGEKMIFQVPPPQNFIQALEKLRSNKF